EDRRPRRPSPRRARHHRRHAARRILSLRARRPHLRRRRRGAQGDGRQAHLARPRPQVGLNTLPMLSIDLTGKRALVAGVADDGGFGFAIAKALAEAGATVCVGTWPPALNIFQTLLSRGKLDASRKLSSGKLLDFEKIYPFDAAWDTMADVPEDVRTSKRYAERGDFTVEGLAKSLVADFGEKPIDYVVHSLANGPEVKKLLLE